MAQFIGVFFVAAWNIYETNKKMTMYEKQREELWNSYKEKYYIRYEANRYKGEHEQRQKINGDL